MASDPSPVFKPLPGRTVDRSAAYLALLRELLSLVGAEPPADDAPHWRIPAMRAVGDAVKARAQQGSVPDEWFEPLMRAAVYEPDPSFNRFLVWPAIAAYGRRRVLLALIGYLDTGTPADIAGAARAWYSAGYRADAAERESLRDLGRRYSHTALRRFVTFDDLDARRCLLPGLSLDTRHYPADMHDLVAQAIHIARTSGDDYLRHRVEIQLRLE